MSTTPEMTVEVIDYTVEKGPFWYVVVDGTPMSPELPLPLEHALLEFHREAEDAAEDGGVVELRQCNADDLSWAGVTPYGEDEGEDDQ